MTSCPRQLHGLLNLKAQDFWEDSGSHLLYARHSLDSTYIISFVPSAALWGGIVFWSDICYTCPVLF